MTTKTTPALNKSSPSTNDSRFQTLAQSDDTVAVAGSINVVFLETEVDAAKIPDGFVDQDVLLALDESIPARNAALGVARAELTASLPANSLAKLRLKRGLSQRQLAEIAGMKQSAIARLECNGVDPQLSTMRRLAEALDVSIAEIASALARESLDV